MATFPTLTTRLRALLDLARVVRSEDDLRAVLAGVVAAVAELLEVRTVALNPYRPAWDAFVVSDAPGSDEARAALLGTTSSRDDWTPLLVEGHRRCGVYVVPGDAVD